MDVLGIDISKKKLDGCLLREGKVILEKQIPNNPKAITLLLKELQDTQGVCFPSLLICCEHTGLYSYPLTQVASELFISLWIEDPSQIKYSSGLFRGKNDRMDARKIALYGYRFYDKRSLYVDFDQDIRELKLLQSERTSLISDKAKYQGKLNGQEEFMEKEIFLRKKNRLLVLIQTLEETIKDIDLQIKNHH